MTEEINIQKKIFCSICGKLIDFNKPEEHSNCEKIKKQQNELYKSTQDLIIND